MGNYYEEHEAEKKRLYAMHDRITALSYKEMLTELSYYEDLELRNLRVIFASEWSDFKELP